MWRRLSRALEWHIGFARRGGRRSIVPVLISKSHPHRLFLKPYARTVSIDTSFPARICDSSLTEILMRPPYYVPWIRLRGTTLLATFLFLALSQSLSQSAQDPDLQQLKAKLQKLEEEMQELKGQIDAVEHANNPPPLPRVHHLLILRELNRQRISQQRQLGKKNTRAPSICMALS